MRNHLGQIECRLCLTLHPNEGNYLAHTQVRKYEQHGGQPMYLRAASSVALREHGVLHTFAQGKRHQQNLAKRAAREAAEKQAAPAPQKRAAVKKTGAHSHSCVTHSLHRVHVANMAIY